MKVRKSFVIGIIITLLLLAGAFVAYYLSQQQQDVRQRAAEPTSTKPFGKAAQFSAVNPATDPVTTNSIVTHDKNFTLEFWINPAIVQGDNVPPFFPLVESVLSSDSSECQDNFGILAYRIGTTDTYSIHATILPFSVDGINLTSDSHPVKYNEWSNIAVTLNNTTHVAKLFVNGVQTDAQAVGKVFCSDLNYQIGYEVADGGGIATYVGDMDELRLSSSIRYDTTYTPNTVPFTPDANTLGLWHFNNNLLNEFDNLPLSDPSDAITFTDSTVGVASPPACQATLATCSWDPADDAQSYHYIIREQGKDTPIAEGDVTAPGTSTSFVSEANKTYTCDISAVNACGTGTKGSATAACIVPTATPTPTGTPVPTNSPTPTPLPTNTPTPTPTLRPSETPVPTNSPTPTPLPTNTPTPTPTLLPSQTPVPTNSPTPTPLIATNTPIPPSNTPIPTNTPIPGVPTETPTPTLPSPGSGVQTFTIVGGILLTILGALILFAL